MRTVGRCLAAYFWQCRRAVLAGLLLLTVLGAVGAVAAGQAIIGIAAVVVMAVAVWCGWRIRTPPGRELTRLYLHFAALVDAHCGGQRLVTTLDGDERFLRCYKRKRYRGFFRASLATGVELPAIDQPGYLSGDMFVLFPFTNVVWKAHQGAFIDEAGELIPTPAEADTTTAAPRAADTVRFAFRTGQGFASETDLRSLIELIRGADELDVAG